MTGLSSRFFTANDIPSMGRSSSGKEVHGGGFPEGGNSSPSVGANGAGGPSDSAVSSVGGGFPPAPPEGGGSCPLSSEGGGGGGKPWCCSDGIRRTSVDLVKTQRVSSYHTKLPATKIMMGSPLNKYTMCKMYEKISLIVNTSLILSNQTEGL